jgi:hypothetical protein
MFKMSSVLACTLCGGRVGTTMHVERTKHISVYLYTCLSYPARKLYVFCIVLCSLRPV